MNTLVRWPRLSEQQTLWAKASITLAALTIAGFVVSTLFFDRVAFQSNPFLTVLGFLFLIDWSVRPWQVLALLSAALSVVIVLWIDSVAVEYRYASERQDSELRRQAKRQFGWVERVSRLRTLVVICFWLLVGGHTVLVLNSQKCWFGVPANVQSWAQWVYSDRMPKSDCPATLPQ